MSRRPGSGFVLLLCLAVLGGGYVYASRQGYVNRLKERLFPRSPQVVRLSPGDFPAGVAAPAGEVALVPLRPTLIGFNPRGSSAALLLATGGVGVGREGQLRSEGLFKVGYALDARAVAFGREDDLRAAFLRGGDHGGVDLAALSVDRLAHWAPALRDVAPRSVMLLGRSRGQEALAAVGVGSLGELRGKRIAVYPNGSAHYFALWVLSRAGLTPGEVSWVELQSNLEAGAALREGRVEAAVGLRGDVELAAKDRQGRVLASTADAPHLVATVLVARGDFAARYPDAMRRVIRGLLDAGAAVQRDGSEGARLLGEVAPYLGDPSEAIASAPPANLKDNLAFFNLSGAAPVTYDELFQSAGALLVKLGRTSSIPRAEDTRDLGALRYVAESRGP